MKRAPERKGGRWWAPELGGNLGSKKDLGSRRDPSLLVQKQGRQERSQ